VTPVRDDAAAWLAVRRAVPEVLGALVRRFGDFDTCEDAVQDALVSAVVRWPADGFPVNPAAWLTTAATRKMIDQHRSASARRVREETEGTLEPADPPEPPPAGDESLRLLYLCCHPALTPSSQVALTLRAVCGLTTAEIARAFLAPEATMAQRISRAKKRVAQSGATFDLPDGAELAERTAAVLAVVYLVFNEGYTTSAGGHLLRADLTAEAVRLARLLHAELPDDSEVAGLLALMLLTEARRPARTDDDGSLVPLAEQDRRRWDADAIAEGVELVSRALAHGPLGPYKLQAAIAAVHDEASTATDTDWPQVLALYDLLERVAPSPVVTLNRAVAVAMVDGPDAGLELVDTLGDDARLSTWHHYHSTRAHLLEMAGDYDEALDAYRDAARRSTNLVERRHLLDRATRLHQH
jgi:RNA polymerase sigma factor (sigma-70 family)